MSNQPKWAWWVVGIVIPVIGIIVSIQLASKSDSGDKSDAGSQSQSASSGASASGGSGTGSVTGGSESKAATPPVADQPAKVMAGPVKITLKPGASNLDLDTSSPVPSPSDNGADMFVGFNLPDLGISPLRSGKVLAPASPDGPEPTAADCRRLVGKNGGYSSGDLTPGTRLCLQTGEGHIAYLRITAVPTRQAVMFEATVWE